MKSALLSSDFLEQYKQGVRLFSDVILQYIDLSNIDLNCITIKNSKLFFATFRDCNFSNAKFINCEIIYGTFYGGNFKNALLDNCVIDATLFQRIQAKEMKILRSRLVW